MGLFRKKEPKIAQEKKERRGIRKSKFEVLVENELRLYDTSVGKIVSIVGEGDYQTTQELNDGTVTLFVTDAGNDQRENNIAKQVQELNDKNLDIDLLAIQSKLPQEVNGERVHDYALRIKPDGAATFVMNGAMDNSLVTVRNNKIVTNDSCYRSHHITGPLESRAMLSYYENERPEAILQFQTGDIVIILSEEASSSIAPIEIEKIVEYYKGNIQEIQKHLHKTSTVLLQQAQKKLTEIPDPAFLALKLNEGTIQVIQVQLPSAQVEAQPELVQSEPVQSAQAEPQQQQAVNEPATAEISDSTSNAPAQPEPIQSEQVQPKPETESRTKKWRQRLQSIAEKVKQLLVKSPAEQENTTPVADNTPSMRFNLMTPKPAEKKESTNKQKELQEFKDQLEALENQSQSDLDNQAKKISGLIQAHISLVNQDIVKKEAESNIELIKNLVRNTWMDLGNLNAEALHDALCKTSWQEKKEATKNAKGWEKFFSGSQSEVLNMLLKGASVRTVIALGLTAAGGFAFGSTTLLASGVAGITKGAVSITALRTGLSFLGMDAAATGWRFGHAESALSKQIDQAQSAEELAGRMHEFERLCVVLGKMPDENKVYQKSIDALAQKLQESGDDATKKYLQIMNNLYREEAKIDKQIRKKDWFWFAGKLTAASLLGSGVVAAKVFPAIKELSGFSEESAVKFTDKLMGWLQRPLTSVTDGIETVKEWLASIDHSGTSTDSALPLIESDAATPLPENEGELPIPGQDVDTPAPGDIDKTVANISVPASSANIEDTSSGGGVRGAAMPLSPDHAAGASGTVSTPVGDATSAVTSREVVAPSASADSTIVESARSAPADSSGSKSIVKSSETSTSPEHVAPATPLEQPVTLKETVGETQWKKMTVHAQTASGAKGEGISHALMRQYDSGVSEAMKNTTVEINGKSSAIYTDKAHSQVWVKDPEKLAVQIEGKKVCFYDAESGKPIPNNELGKYLEIKDPVAKPPLAKLQPQYHPEPTRLSPEMTIDQGKEMQPTFYRGAEVIPPTEEQLATSSTGTPHIAENFDRSDFGGKIFPQSVEHAIPSEHSVSQASVDVAATSSLPNQPAVTPEVAAPVQAPKSVSINMEDALHATPTPSFEEAPTELIVRQPVSPEPTQPHINVDANPMPAEASVAKTEIETPIQPPKPSVVPAKTIDVVTAMNEAPAVSTIPANRLVEFYNNSLQSETALRNALSELIKNNRPAYADGILYRLQNGAIQIAHLDDTKNWFSVSAEKFTKLRDYLTASAHRIGEDVPMEKFKEIIDSGKKIAAK